MDTRLVHPFTSIVAGPTGCGKTTFVVSLLRHSHTLVNLPPEKITWCYGEWQPLYSTLSTIHPNLERVEGLPDLSSFDPNNRNLVVIDDLMSETDERVTKLFTKKSLHCNTSVIYLVQNIFPKGKDSRTISINAQYMVLFKNPLFYKHNLYVNFSFCFVVLFYVILFYYVALCYVILCFD